MSLYRSTKRWHFQASLVAFWDVSCGFTLLDSSLNNRFRIREEYWQATRVTKQVPLRFSFATWTAWWRDLHNAGPDLHHSCPPLPKDIILERLDCLRDLKQCIWTHFGGGTGERLVRSLEEC